MEKIVVKEKEGWCFLESCDETQGDLMPFIKLIGTSSHADPVQERNWTEEVDILWLENSNCLLSRKVIWEGLRSR